MSEKRLGHISVMVTGAGRGLGLAIAKRLSDDGAAVALHCNRSADSALAAVNTINTNGGKACLVQADLSSAEQTKTAYTAAEEQLKQLQAPALNALVLNAGVSKGQPLIGADIDEFRAVMETNLISAMHLTSLITPQILRGKFGRIVALSSVVAESGGLTGQAAYAASKAGLLGFIKTAANELSPRGDITANCISPGVIPTDMSAHALKQFAEPMQRAIPLEKFGAADDIAGAAAFLLSEDASYINGHNLKVDGGFSLKYISRKKTNKQN